LFGVWYFLLLFVCVVGLLWLVVLVVCDIWWFEWDVVWWEGVDDLLGGLFDVVVDVVVLCFV